MVQSDMIYFGRIVDDPKYWNHPFVIVDVAGDGSQNRVVGVNFDVFAGYLMGVRFSRNLEPGNFNNGLSPDIDLGQRLKVNPLTVGVLSRLLKKVNLEQATAAPVASD